MKLLLHTCCAPCSLSLVPFFLFFCITPDLFWFNPNIHPYTEYKARRDCLIDYAKEMELSVKVKENYGLREFVKAVAADIDSRCKHCYYVRMLETAKFAKENGYDAFSTTLLCSPYQDHEGIKRAGEALAAEFGIEFLYRDFRPNFRECNNKAREKGFYMQKYCGCIFSEEDRYQKQILRDKERFNA